MFHWAVAIHSKILAAPWTLTLHAFSLLAFRLFGTACEWLQFVYDFFFVWDNYVCVYACYTFVLSFACLNVYDHKACMITGFAWLCLALLACTHVYVFLVRAKAYFLGIWRESYAWVICRVPILMLELMHTIDGCHFIWMFACVLCIYITTSFL